MSLIHTTINSISYTGDITIGDVSTVLPFGNTVDYMELEGRYVREMLEVSVEEYDPVELPGKLLQTSGNFTMGNIRSRCFLPGGCSIIVLGC